MTKACSMACSITCGVLPFHGVRALGASSGASLAPAATLAGLRSSTARAAALQSAKGLRWRSAFSNLGGRPSAPRGRGGSLVVRALFEKFTERSIKSVMLAQEEARRLLSPEAGTEHLLMGLIAEDQGPRVAFLGTGISLEKARAALETMQPQKARREPPRDLPFARDARRIFETALMESRRMGMSFIAPEHIFLALLSAGDSNSRQLFEKLRIDTDRLKVEAMRRLKGEAEGDTQRKKVAAASERRTEEGGSALDSFCRDLCKEAEASRMDPVIGRTREVVRVTQILARRTKNNPILLGEPGVGKTAIAEGLARAIVSGFNADGTPLPSFLEGKRVLSLDVGLLMAGAKERGELELRVTKLLSESKAAGNVIMVIDEVHTLVGAGAVGRGGGGGGGLDISNLLKPALARAELQCIGATTLTEHRRYVEKDPALERRFQPVIVDEPSTAEAEEILEGLRERYERHHRCVYSSEALRAAVTLSARYVADRFLPDKAIDLMDEAGSRVRIAAYHARLESGGRSSLDAAAASYSELEQVMDTKEEAVKDFLYEEAALLRSRELELKTRLSGSPEEAPVVPVVGREHVEAVLSAWTGIPVERMGQDEQEKLLTLPEALSGRVIGQGDAVDATSRALQRAGSGLKNPDRPIAALLFSGPTGVGKTELAKSLSDHYFGSEGSMVRLDMSEYMERHSVSKLIGAPPGYVGYGEGGKLTEAVRRRPFSVVLLDEIEKAHPDVFNILLQVIEDGRLTDSQGRVVSFKNTLIILTSNVGSSVIAKGGGSIGFELPGSEPDGGKFSRVRSLVMEELKAFFRPELLNRLDEVVVFRQLGKQEVRTIADLELAKTAARCAERGIGLEVSSALMARIVEEGYSESLGARELRRAVTRLVDDPLSEAILHQEVGSGEVALVDCTADGRVLVLNRARNNIVQATGAVVYSSKPANVSNNVVA